MTYTGLNNMKHFSYFKLNLYKLIIFDKKIKKSFVIYVMVRLKCYVNKCYY